MELGFIGSWGKGFRIPPPAEEQEALGSPGPPDSPELQLVALPAADRPPRAPPAVADMTLLDGCSPAQFCQQPRRTLSSERTELNLHKQVSAKTCGRSRPSSSGVPTPSHVAAPGQLQARLSGT